jgi:hypothetical protein
VKFKKLHNNENVTKTCGCEFRYISDMFERMLFENKIEPFRCYRSGHSSYKQIETGFNPDTIEMFIFLGKEVE